MDKKNKKSNIEEEELIGGEVSLDVRIASLCDGLRSIGMKNYADEVEVKFLAFRAAETKK